jgi:hypothetical protein
VFIGRCRYDRVKRVVFKWKHIRRVDHDIDAGARLEVSANIVDILAYALSQAAIDIIGSDIENSAIFGRAITIQKLLANFIS